MRLEIKYLSLSHPYISESEFASAFAAQVHSLCASVTAVYLPFFVFGSVLTRLDSEIESS